MEAVKALFTTDVGLFSLAVIGFMVAMGWYVFSHVRRLMNSKPGTEGW